MVDNSNAIGAPQIVGPEQKSRLGVVPKAAAPGQDFKTLLMDSINEVNRLQAEADQARIDLVTGKAENVAEVFTAVKKAELAFQTLIY